MTINTLYKTIQQRIKYMPDNSYIASLIREGTDRIIQKVGEEATEVVIAAKNERKQRIIEETADLLFHTLILLSAYNISPKEILEELENRRT